MELFRQDWFPIFRPSPTKPFKVREVSSLGRNYTIYAYVGISIRKLIFRSNTFNLAVPVKRVRVCFDVSPISVYSGIITMPIQTILIGLVSTKLHRC